MLLALLGSVVVYRSGRRTEALVLTAAVAGGVIWSNALAYHTVNLGPRDQLAELEEIGEEFAGQGPTLMTEYEPFGARYFLRDTDPESAGGAASAIRASSRRNHGAKERLRRPR